MSNDRFTIETDGKMLPALLHALMLGSTTAMCCGSPGVKNEFKRLYEQLAAQAGVDFRDVDEYAWFAACKAMARASTFRWFTRTGWNDKDGGEVSLIVDGKEMKLGYRLKGDLPELPAIREFLERHAHLEAVRLDPITSWRDYRPEDHPDETPAPAP